MQKTNSRKIAALLLALLVLVTALVLPAYASAASAGSRVLDARAAEIDEALAPALKSKADALEADARGYEASGEILKDADGNDIDMAAYIADLKEPAAALRSMTYISYELAILENLYEKYYIGV